MLLLVRVFMYTYLDAAEARVTRKLGGEAGPEVGEVYGAAKPDCNHDVYSVHEYCSRAHGLLRRGIIRRRRGSWRAYREWPAACW